ncbi:hypothetical protein WN51_05406 [Melipona quadrifasciata]|uniref:Uncharacterized protein n=1 Tax=Melipona quadrifasciata TaxID=166423 RepID=A0A0M8ZVC3_9HYME|nr:hypothetical protein WN51_05406 [Melipona quadrifasciata]
MEHEIARTASILRTGSKNVRDHSKFQNESSCSLATQKKKKEKHVINLYISIV